MSNNHNDDYKVGYGKPPKSTQFGAENGNPINRNGAPSKKQLQRKNRLSHEAMRQAFLNVGAERMNVKEGDDSINMSKIEYLAKKLYNKAANGDGNLRAAELYLRYLNNFTKDQDKVLYDLMELTLKVEGERTEASLYPGSKRHYDAMYSYFRMRDDFRELEGVSNWIYMDDEPITKDDWKFFKQCCDALQNDPKKTLPWPPPYPSRKED